MRAEYLLFDLLVLAVPLLVGAWRRAWFYDRLGTALRAVIGVGVPFVLWDAAVHQAVVGFLRAQAAQSPVR